MINLLLIQDGIVSDISNLVKQIRTTGRKGAAGRNLSVDLIDATNHDRVDIQVIKGAQCIFKWKDKELFRGMIEDRSNSSSKSMTLNARDSLIHFANNDDTFYYQNKTASDIFRDVCTRFQIDTGEIVDTGFVIATLPKVETSIWDVVLDALSLTYQSTGERYYIHSELGKASLIKRKDAIIEWVVEPGANLLNWDYSESIKDIKTRITLLSDNGTVVAQEKNEELEASIGIFQRIVKPDDKLSAGQLTDMAKTLLAEDGSIKQNLRIKVLGIPEVISGSALTVIIPEIGISRSFYVDEDTHIFKGRYHEMDLTLNYTNEF